jgi:hypothetical protein
MSPARLIRVELPDFGMPTSIPTIPDGIYSSRVRTLLDRAESRGLEIVIVFADREHSANVSYLTGFDPRFEEALLLLTTDGDPSILVGNECLGTAKAAPLQMRVELFQDFSLPGQPRDRSRSLQEIFSAAGIASGTKVGLVGWKTFADSAHSDVPSYLVDELRALAGAEQVENVTDLLIDSADGMRVINEVEQLAYFEYAACHTSSGVRNLLFELRPGMTEQEAVSLLRWNGAPLSCHLMLTAGDRARLGLLSPGDRVIAEGDPFTVAYGIWGALNCRAGFVTGGPDGLGPGIEDYVEKLVAPYFETVVEWYQALHIGQRGNVLQEIVDRRLGDPFFGIFLNPGHQIHYDEWVNTPVGPGSAVELQSGMALQVDIIPATGTPYFTTNIEDGIALADETLRADIARGFPEMWQRIEERRRFMRDLLGIDLHPDVLPFSNIPAYLPPFLLSPDRVMSMA